MESLRLGPETDFAEALKGHPGLGAFGVGRELKNLSTLLSPDEFVLDVLQGAYSNQTGLLIRTTTRLLFFAKGFVSTKVEEFPLDKVTSVQYTTGLMLGDVTVFASGNKAEIKNTIKAYTKTFVDGLRTQLDVAKRAAPLDAATVSQSSPTMAELERLVSLKERGFLSDEEFNVAKRKVLGL
jgi:hypothetical protein